MSTTRKPNSSNVQRRKELVNPIGHPGPTEIKRYNLASIETRSEIRSDQIKVPPEAADAWVHGHQSTAEATAGWQIHQGMLDRHDLHYLLYMYHK